MNSILKYGAAVKQIRQEKGISQKKLSEMCGIPYPTYANYENSNREPSEDQLEKIAAALGVTVREVTSVAYTQYLSDNKDESSKQFYAVRSSESDTVIHFLNFAGVNVELLMSVNAADIAGTNPASFSDNITTSSEDTGRPWKCHCLNGDTIPATLEMVKLTGSGLVYYDPRRLSSIPAADRCLYLDPVDFAEYIHDIQDYIRLSLVKLKRQSAPAYPDESEDRQYIVSNASNLALDPDGRKRLTHPDLLHIAPESF